MIMLAYRPIGRRQAPGNHHKGRLYGAHEAAAFSVWMRYALVIAEIRTVRIRSRFLLERHQQPMSANPRSQDLVLQRTRNKVPAHAAPIYGVARLRRALARSSEGTIRRILALPIA